MATITGAEVAIWALSIVLVLSIVVNVLLGCIMSEQLSLKNITQRSLESGLSEARREKDRIQRLRDKAEEKLKMIQHLLSEEKED